jgi:micrococcal nuclease
MKHSRAFLLVFVLLFISITSFSQYKGKITKVYDGETFWVKMENGDIDSVKLWGVDCPELEQQYGVAAQKNLESHINREISMEYKTRDKNNFMLAIVSYKTKNNEEIILNQMLIEQGYAWKNKFTDDKKLEKLQKQAEKNNAGLWRNSDPTPPWEWRKQHK